MKPIITFNAGSSSLKFAVFDGGLVQLLAGQVAGYGPDALQAALAEVEAQGIVLQRPIERASRTEALLNAFQLNLRALSLLALVVGMFLVYNTLTVAVLQRLPLLGTLRCLAHARRSSVVVAAATIAPGSAAA